MIRNTLTDIIKCSIIPVTLLTGVTACNSDNDASVIDEPPIVNQ